MNTHLPSNEAKFYFQRFGFCAPQIGSPPHPDLGMVVVIPCHNEPDLLATLQSLSQCRRPRCAVEIILVINAGEEATPGIIRQNAESANLAERWRKQSEDERFRLYSLMFPSLPQKQAGVGLARKIGMDEALFRLDQLQNLHCPIVCFDADCQCEENYLVALEDYFSNYPDSPGCSIYFEHLLDGLAPENLEAIARYELHLRCYIQGLRWAGYPHAFHTIGSSMAVRAHVYMKQGGMNKRKAGEDFYFLHKIIPLGNFGDLAATAVLPSPRASDRVPFGTGRAVREFLERKELFTYPFEAFQDLKSFFSVAPEIRNTSALENHHLPEAIQTFLKANYFSAAIEEIAENSASSQTFLARFYRWFDGFRVMKFIHHARDHFYGPSTIKRLASALSEALKLETGPQTMGETLNLFRKWERDHPKLPNFI